AEAEAGLGRDAHERDFLEVAAVGIAGREAEFLEFTDEVIDGLFLAGRAGAAALELVRSEDLGPGENARGGNVVGGIGRRDRGGRAERRADQDGGETTHGATLPAAKRLAIPLRPAVIS